MNQSPLLIFTNEIANAKQITGNRKHTEAELIEFCKKNDRSAQRELYEQYSHLLKGVCLRYASNEMEAEDILHDAFIQIFKTIDQFNFSGALGAWMRKITVNKALEHYRKNSRRTIQMNEYRVFNSEITTEDNAIDQLELIDLLNLIRKLPTGFRTVFNLYAIEGYNHREIGELLNISENTSKSQYSRARIILRNMIEEEYSINPSYLNNANGI